MSLSLSPKALFQQQEQASSAFRGIAHSAAFQQGLSAALAEYSHGGKATTEQLQGVRTFISVLMNIAEQGDKPKRLPAKALNYEQFATEPAKA